MLADLVNYVGPRLRGQRVRFGEERTGRLRYTKDIERRRGNGNLEGRVLCVSDFTGRALLNLLLHRN